MPTTRASVRTGSSASPPGSQTKSAGTKRKAAGTPSKKSPAKRGKKEQKTLEDTMDIDKPDEISKPDAEDHPPGTGSKREGPDPNDTIVDSDEEDAKIEEKAQRAEKEEKKQTNADANGNKHAGEKKSNGVSAEKKDDSKSKPENEKPSTEDEEAMIQAGEEAEKELENDGDKKAEKDTNKTDEKADDKSTKQHTEESTSNPTENGNTEEVNAAVEQKLEKAEPEEAVEQDSNRAKAEPSNILEKGIIYFFIRGRVGLDDPSSVDEIQRSYFILRPIPTGGKLADSAPIGDAGKNRIIALPKKVFPASRRDTFLCFVEAADVSFETIRDEHLKKSEYATKTQGTRHTPAAKPIAEGIYALTSTGRESHLSYILTIPSELGEVQKDIGLSSRGAFVTSVKNPDAPSAPGTAPAQQAEYPDGVKKDFRTLRWGRLEPAHLNSPNAQFLLIGEGEQDKLDKAVQPENGDGQKEGKELPLEEMELLGKEDRERIRGLSGGDSEAIFKDLGLSKEDYAKIQTSWQ